MSMGKPMANYAAAKRVGDFVVMSGVVAGDPAKALGLAWDGRLAPGCPADLVVLAATDEHELIGPRGRLRSVYRAGQLLEPNTP